MDEDRIKALVAEMVTRVVRAEIKATEGRMNALVSKLSGNDQKLKRAIDGCWEALIEQGYTLAAIRSLLPYTDAEFNARRLMVQDASKRRAEAQKKRVN